jgi:HEPN domain-containing protein
MISEMGEIIFVLLFITTFVKINLLFWQFRFSPMDDKIKYWVELSDYDIDTAKAMLRSKRYLYVGFMCHQTIEKILKAYYAATTGLIPPHTHNLAFLSEKSGIVELMTEEQKSFLDKIEPMNIQARYPEYKERLLKELSEIKCKKMLAQTNLFQQWIKQQLSTR